jgi:intraflagellar transport protein 74
MINDLDLEQRNEYENLLNENKMLMNVINNQRMELDEINQKLAIAENRLRMDSQKLKGQLLKE